ncbi:MAG: hypothetical protein WC708_12905 [Lentisphaeria bacterium]
MKHPPPPACRPAPGLAVLLFVAAGLLLSGGLGRAQNTPTLSPPTPFQTAPDISTRGAGDPDYVPPKPKKRSGHAIRHGYKNVTDNAIRHGYTTPTDRAVRHGYQKKTDNAVRHGYQNVTDHAIRHGY